MKLSNALKDALLHQLLLNFRNGFGSNLNIDDYGYRIRFFDSSKIAVSNPLADKEFTSTVFAQTAPVGMILDFGVTIRIPATAFTISKRSIKLLGTYTEVAKFNGVADLACVYAVSLFPTSGAIASLTGEKRLFMTDSIVPNGQQGAFVLTKTVMQAGDAVTIADFTLNLIEP